MIDLLYASKCGTHQTRNKVFAMEQMYITRKILTTQVVKCYIVLRDITIHACTSNNILTTTIYTATSRYVPKFQSVYPGLTCCSEDILHIHFSFTFALATSLCLMQLPEGSAFFWIHGCFMMSSRQSLLLESLTSSCTQSHQKNQ